MDETGFKRKKIEAITLGEKIGRLRSEYRMSFVEISRATKIPIKYLKSLECAEYEKLPADVYVRGYLRSYAKHLGLPEETLIKLYEKEQHINKNLGRERMVSGVRPRVPLQGSRFVITSKEVLIGCVVTVLFVIGVYLYKEFHSFVSDPYLIVNQPLNDSVVSDAALDLSGKADVRAVVSVNGTVVPVASDGSFHENLVLHSGQNTLVVVAKNRFEREKKIVLSIRADIASGTMTIPEPVPSDWDRKEKTFSVEFSVRRGSTPVMIEVDGVLVYSGLLEAKAPRVLNGMKSVKIRSENGAETLVRVEAGPLEPLSSDSGLAEREFFSPNL